MDKNKYASEITFCRRRRGLYVTATDYSQMNECLDLYKTRAKGARAGASGHDFFGITKTEVVRCPMSRWTYRPLNTRNAFESIMAHCGTDHESAFPCTFHFKCQKGPITFVFPARTEADCNHGEGEKGGVM